MFGTKRSSHVTSEEGFSILTLATRRRCIYIAKVGQDSRRQWFDSSTVERHQQAGALRQQVRNSHTVLVRVSTSLCTTFQPLNYPVYGSKLLNYLHIRHMPTQFQIFSPQLKPSTNPHRASILLRMDYTLITSDLQASDTFLRIIFCAPVTHVFINYRSILKF